MLTNDHEAALVALVTRTAKVQALRTVLDAAAFLRAIGHRQSAEKLIQYREKVMQRGER